MLFKSGEYTNTSEGGTHGLFSGTILAFKWRALGKP
jgi:hypothetical protein